MDDWCAVGPPPLAPPPPLPPAPPVTRLCQAAVAEAVVLAIAGVKGDAEWSLSRRIDGEEGNDVGDGDDAVCRSDGNKESMISQQSLSCTKKGRGYGVREPHSG